MPPPTVATRRWMRSPRRLLVALATATAVSSGALTWLAWEVLQQDRAVAAQADLERLEHRADRVAQALDRAIADAVEALGTAIENPSASSRALLDDGVLLRLTPSTIEAVSPSRLLFHPVAPPRREPPPNVFADAERLEFQQPDPARAVAAYRTLARSADPAIRAAALMRLGGLLRRSRQYEAARDTYREMASLGDVPVAGLPADLLAADGTWRALDQMQQPEASREAARLLYRELAGGQWTLTEGQYEFYAGEAAVAARIDTATDRTAAAVARAASGFWRTWLTQPSPRGRQSARVDGVPLLVLWSGMPGGATAWIVEPARILARLGPEHEAGTTLTDAEGAVVAGQLDRSTRSVTRAAADTRLPWTLRVTNAPGTPATATFTRNRLVVGGLGVMVAFLIAGAYFIGRAVRQESELARLQSEFVSAVSHEFRTPLAAMRQLSELLAAGRVPSEERRQHHYESLAGESRRLQRLVENVLDFGSLEAGARAFTLEPVDPRALVEQVVADFQSQLAPPDCHIEISGDTGPRRLLADADALSMALRNLLDNAVKYSRSAGAILVSWTVKGDRIALSVRDEGPGIAPAEQSRIFQKFVRGAAASAANVKGAGLGLAMVQYVVSGHGGEIAVSSEPGAGATFTLLLPAAAPSISMQSTGVRERRGAEG